MWDQVDPHIFVHNCLSEYVIAKRFNRESVCVWAILSWREHFPGTWVWVYECPHFLLWGSEALISMNFKMSKYVKLIEHSCVYEWQRWLQFRSMWKGGGSVCKCPLSVCTIHKIYIKIFVIEGSITWDVTMGSNYVSSMRAIVYWCCNCVKHDLKPKVCATVTNKAVKLMNGWSPQRKFQSLFTWIHCEWESVGVNIEIVDFKSKSDKSKVCGMLEPWSIWSSL